MSALCPIYGMPEGCNDGKSGIQIGYWIGKEDIAGYAYDSSGNITSLTVESGCYFKTLNFEKEDAVFTPSLGGVVTSRFFIQKLAFMFKKMGIRSRQHVQAAAAVNGAVFILRDWNNNTIVMGLEMGAFLDAAEGTTGQKMGEVNGEQLSFTANEPRKEFYMPSSVFATLPIEN